MADEADILKFKPWKHHHEPWQSFPAFAEWADATTPRDDEDGLRGVRTAAALAGTVGLLCRAVIAQLDPANDQAEVVQTIAGEVSRVLHTATVLADEVGFNPIRTLVGDIDKYAVDFRTAYGISEEVPWGERGYMTQNIVVRLAGHLLPVCYAISIDRFTLDGLMRSHANDEILKGIHELQTLADAYDLKLSACLERHVRSVNEDELRSKTRGDDRDGRC